MMKYKQVNNNVYNLTHFDKEIIEEVNKLVTTFLGDDIDSLSPIVINKLFEDLLIVKLSTILSKEDIIEVNRTYYFVITYKQLNIRFNFRNIEEDNETSLVCGSTMSVINT